MSKLIRLYDFIGTGLIVKWPTGIIYTLQTAGDWCLWPEAEGFFITIGNDADENDKFISKQKQLWNYFKEPNIEIEGAIRGISEKNASYIDGLLHEPPSLSYINVDRSLLGKSHEGWVHVNVQEYNKVDHLRIFNNFEKFPLRAILIWGC